MRFRLNLQALSIVEVLVCDHFHPHMVRYKEYVMVQLQMSELVLVLRQGLPMEQEFLI
jgi:hypothetical protein